MSPDPLADLERASRALVDLLTAVRPDQWAAPTPCTEWSVRDLVDHLVGSNLMFLAIFGERPMPERGTDILGDDPVAAYTASASALEAATPQRRLLAQERLLEGVFGRIRDVISGPDGLLYFCTNNRDGRGTPSATDDRIVRLVPES